MKIWTRMTALLLVLALLSACATAGEYIGADAAETPEAAASVEVLPEETAAEEELAPQEADAEQPDAAEETAAAEATETPAPDEEPEQPVEPEQPDAAPALDVQDAAPVIGLTVVPAYGSDTFVNGVVYDPNGGKIDAEKYRVTLYVQLEEGYAYWVKPTEATPCVSVNADGSFALDYVAAFTDRSAKLLHILLIPADYTPKLHDFEDAKAHALDYVKVERTKDGDNTVIPERTAPAPDPGKPSGLSVSADKIGVNVGFYTVGKPGDPLPRAQIHSQLVKAAAFADTVRFYSASGDIQTAYEMAHDMGLKVVGTAWLGRDDFANDRELDGLIELCNKGYVDVACVGSETLLRGDLTPYSLIEEMNKVREKLNNKAIPVTTADSGGILLEKPEIRNACDILMPNLYPYWEGNAIENAAASFAAQVRNLSLSSPGKEILISETGWPTAGETQKDAVAGEEQAAAYFNAIRDWSLNTGTVVLWFDAADEPWKKSDEQEAGAHWGILTKDLELKEGYAAAPFFADITLPEALLTDISSIKNVSGGVQVKWSAARDAVRYELYWKSGKSWKLAGKTTKTKLTVKKLGGKALKAGKRYTFAVKAVGKSSSGTRSADESVVYLTAPTWKSLRSSNSGVVSLSWKKSAGVSGTQIQYSSVKSFTYDRTTDKVGKKYSTFTMVGCTEPGETLYFRLRTYKSVSGTKSYSPWSKTKKLKITK